MLEMGTLKYSQRNVKVTITIPFQLLDKVSLANGYEGLVKATFTSPLN